MKRQGIRNNFIYQLVYNAAILALPLVLSPVLTRTLGSRALGTYAYVNSIAYYFVIFANLGITTYGQRLISRSRGNREALGKSFWSLLWVHTLVSLGIVFAYILFICLFVKEDQTVYRLHLLYIASALFDVTWLFYGLENFKRVVIKDLSVKLLCFLLILLTVRGPEDLPLYTLIETGTLFAGNLFLLPVALQEIPFTKFRAADCRAHLKPLLTLFIATLAASLYTVFDKTLLGLMAGKEQVAFYEYANKIICVPRALLLCIGAVIFPRACAFFEAKDRAAARTLAKNAFFVTCVVGIGAVFGLFALGQPFAEVYFGGDFAACGGLITAMAPLVLIVALGDIVRKVYLIPMKRDGIYVLCICLNAVINLAVSVLLIPGLRGYGAVIGTGLAEVFGLGFQLVCCRREIDFKHLLKTLCLFSVDGLGMFFAVRGLVPFAGNPVLSLALRVLIGILIYGILSVFTVWLFYKEIRIFIIDKIKKMAQIRA